MGTVLQGCSLFKQCWNLPAEHCVVMVQAVEAVSELTCQALCCRGAVCLSGDQTYPPGPVLKGCRLLKQCQNLPAGYCVKRCSLFKRCGNLLVGHCVAGEHAI